MDSAKAKPDFSRIGRSNNRKFKGHERRIAKLLTDWSGVPFRRRRVEGRDATVLERESASDVIPVRGETIFSIEAKSGAGFNLDSLLANPCGNKFCEWWFQVCYDAFLLTTTLQPSRPFWPILFFKPYTYADWVAVAREPIDRGLVRFREQGSIARLPHLVFDFYSSCGMVSGSITHSKKNVLRADRPLYPLYLCRWKDFASHVDPASIFR